MSETARQPGNALSAFLKSYENGLNPRLPERCPIPTRVLGYGEISTVLEIEHPDGRRFAYKRMPMFYSEQEVTHYEALVREWVDLCNTRINIHVLASETVHFTDERSGRIIVYIRQNALPKESIGNQIIRRAAPEEAGLLFRAVLKEMRKVYDFNRANAGMIEIGFDAQISNWALRSTATGHHLTQKPELFYLDVSSPLMRLKGVEQLDSELFLRSAPSFLVWLIRLLFLRDVLTRYYDPRKVAVDLLANLYKEQRPDLIPVLLTTINDFFADAGPHITHKEVAAYYREDAWIWRTYLGLRKIDRFLHRAAGRCYPYILPEKVRR
ncbi:MAG: hypothetical protein C4519_00955 [Desulfobacteraceae bacterium]|nr:MAG: hypothetical protein C4519_00955 [Desulfobacteraceae bacterium]